MKAEGGKKKDEKKTGEAAHTEAAASSDSAVILHPSAFHQIRLGPPWQLTPGEGGTRHARKFGRPRTLDANERLWLVCEHVPAAGAVQVNGVLLANLTAPGPFAADITSLLLPRNEIVISLSSDAPLGAVRLEIRTA